MYDQRQCKTSKSQVMMKYKSFQLEGLAKACNLRLCFFPRICCSSSANSFVSTLHNYKKIGTCEVLVWGLDMKSRYKSGRRLYCTFLQIMYGMADELTSHKHFLIYGVATLNPIMHFMWQIITNRLQSWYTTTLSHCWYHMTFLRIGFNLYLENSAELKLAESLLVRRVC